MSFTTTRRALLAGAAMLLAASALPAIAQDKPVLQFSAVFSDAGHPRRDDPAVRRRGRRHRDRRALLRRHAVQAGHRARRAAARQPPDGQHRPAGHREPDPGLVGADLGLSLPRRRPPPRLLRQRGRRRVQEDGRRPARHRTSSGRPTSASARSASRATSRSRRPPISPGVKLRMPGGDAWQFLGTALGANPTPMAYAEVYTGLQTGAIDGQDNPLPNVENMKFYEVMNQIVLTSHLVGYDLLVISKTAWDAMSAEQQTAVPGGGDRGDRHQPGRRTSPARPSSSRSSRTPASTSTSPTSRPSAPTSRSSTSPPTSPRTGRKA